MSDENCDRAWEKLKARYENKRVLINTLLDILFARKPVSKRCAKELGCLPSTVAEVLESLESLGAQSSLYNCFIVYFVSRRLDPETLEDCEIQLPPPNTPSNCTNQRSTLRWENSDFSGLIGAVLICTNDEKGGGRTYKDEMVPFHVDNQRLREN